MGFTGLPGRQLILATPLLISCWGDRLSLGPWAPAASPPELSVNFAFCGVRLELALCLSPGPVTD